MFNLYCNKMLIVINEVNLEILKDDCMTYPVIIFFHPASLI